ncbi:MAG: 50S ribosomal protein L11 [Candidatus Bathyarchaeia archaeon]
MGEKKVVEALVSGGKATAGPPLGPSLGPLGVNVVAVVNKINELTSSYSGMKVPVKITVDVETKEFEVKVGVPTTSALIVSELGIQKGSKTTKHEVVGNLSMKQILKIAKIKRDSLLAVGIKSASKEILGTCLSMGVTVEGKHPLEVQREIDEGKYDELFRES